MLKVCVSVSNITNCYLLQCWKWVSVCVSNITNLHSFHPLWGLPVWVKKLMWVCLYISTGLFTYCGSLSLFDCVCPLVCLHTMVVCLSVWLCMTTGLFAHWADLSVCVCPLVCLHTVAVCLFDCVWPLVCLHTVAVCLSVYVHWSVCILWQSVSVWLCMSAGLFILWWSVCLS